MNVEELLEKQEEQPLPDPSLTETAQSFEVFSRTRVPELIVLILLDFGLAALAVAAAIGRSGEAAIALGATIFGLTALIALLARRLSFSYKVRGNELIFIQGAKKTTFPLEGASLKPLGWFSKADGDFESIRITTREGIRKIPLPDRIIKGDLVRERFLAALAAGGADVHLPGYLPPKGGVKEVDEIKVAGSEAGLGCAGVLIVVVATFLVSMISTSTVFFGLSSMVFLFVVFIPIIIALAVNGMKSKGRSRSILMSSEKLISMRGKELEWEVPREMLTGIVVESRKLPFKNTEVRVVAKTAYQRNLVMMDWSGNRLETRPYLLAHARARGIPVEIRLGGEEPGSGSLSLNE